MIVATTDMFDPDLVPSVQGVLSTCTGLARIPPFGGAIYDASGSWTWVFVFGGLCFLIGSLILIILPLRNRKPITDTIVVNRPNNT